MTRTEIELTALLVGGCLCAASSGCGDIGDAQLPLPIHDRSPREPRVREFVPANASDEVRPQAVVSVVVAPTAEAACPLAVEARLPDFSATSTLINGAGPRAIAGENALISCRVAARPGSEGVFVIDARVLHPELPLRRAAGELGPTSSGTLALELSMRDRSNLTVSCPSQIVEVLDGAIWFRTVNCRTPESDERASCDIEVDAIFENCQQ